MAEDEGQERTEEPTAKRLEKALEDGNVLSSKDLLLAVIMLGGALQLSIGGRFYFNEFLGAFRNGIDISDALQRDVTCRLFYLALGTGAFHCSDGAR